MVRSVYWSDTQVHDHDFCSCAPDIAGRGILPSIQGSNFAAMDHRKQHWTGLPDPLSFCALEPQGRWPTASRSYACHTHHTMLPEASRWCQWCMK